MPLTKLHSKTAWRREFKSLACAARRTAAKPSLSHDQLVDRIANVIVDRTAASGSCTEADLVAAGFSAEEIARHKDDAIARARQATHATLHDGHFPAPVKRRGVRR
jgi:hypothetical protein